MLQGVLLLKYTATSDGTEGAQKIVRLWVHEVYRVFYDRLVDEEDRDMFFSMVKVSTRSKPPSVNFTTKLHVGK